MPQIEPYFMYQYILQQETWRSIRCEILSFERRLIYQQFIAPTYETNCKRTPTAVGNGIHAFLI